MVDGGVAAVSMEAVARGAGVTKPVVYGVFGDRGELLSALLTREETRAYEQIAEAMPAGFDINGDPDALIVDGVAAFLRAVAEHPQRWRLILLPGAGLPRIVREHIEAGRQSVEERMIAFVRWGLAAREGASAGMDPELVAHALMSLCEHGAALVLRDPDHFSPDRLAGFARDLLVAVPRG